MAIHARSEWTDRPVPLPPANKGVGTIVIHHTASSNAEVSWASGRQDDYLRALEHSVTDHVAPGNSVPLIAIDYNILVFPDGTVWEGRGYAAQDAATYHFNTESVSIALIGNYDVNRVPDAMIIGAAEAVRVAMDGGWVTRNARVIGHRDVGTFATACPGRYAEVRLAEIRDLASHPTPTPVKERKNMTVIFWFRDDRDGAIYLWEGNDAIGIGSLKTRDTIIFMNAAQGNPPIKDAGNLPHDVIDTMKRVGIIHK